MLTTIAKPFGWLLMWLYDLFGSYGWALIVFALIVRLILLPFQMKSKKSSMRMSRLQPKLKELEKRHGANQRKYQEEMSKLYKEEHINPMSGCLWSLIPFPFLLALYQAIRYPITVMMGVAEEHLAEGGAILTLLDKLGFESSTSTAYLQLNQSQFISEHWDDFSALGIDKLINIDYSFLGMNLGDQPQWNFMFKVDWSSVGEWLPALGLFMVPVVSALLSFFQTKISQKTNPTAMAGGAGGEQAAKQMKMMTYTMPLVSLYICFIMPAALGLYWIAGSVFSIVQEIVLNKHYTKIMDREDADRAEADRLREAEMERRRQETERLKAENATTINTNTSKKKLQAQQKAETQAVRAAAAREEKAARRERLGIKTEEAKPDSQVGARRYARGRAYVPDRFTNPDEAAEKTEKAAAESENAPAVEETEERVENAEEVETAESSETVETAEAAAPDADSDTSDEKQEAE
ncbi:MAG: membrane protein insertase YidC [Oscillospiraceae bacterium]|nr:membrane protein insertase YidC [Oscillospiraceae bacterium]